MSDITTITDDQKVDAAVTYLTETDYVDHPGMWIDETFVYCHLGEHPKYATLHAYARRDLIDWYDRALTYAQTSSDFDDDELAWYEVEEPQEVAGDG
jgi:hypothetical protein